MVQVLIFGGRTYFRGYDKAEAISLQGRSLSRMSRGGCYGLTNADRLISPAGCSNTPWPFEREGKDGEDQRDRAGKDSIRTRLFCKPRDS